VVSKGTRKKLANFGRVSRGNERKLMSTLGKERDNRLVKTFWTSKSRGALVQIAQTRGAHGGVAWETVKGARHA